MLLHSIGKSFGEIRTVAVNLFITGAGGFVGRVLVSKLHASEQWQIRALTRQFPSTESVGSRLNYIIGDLCDPESYRAALAGVDTVIHLGAVTGKASPEKYHQVNVQATRDLLAICKETGVRRFLYVSTIAAKYKDQRYYTYACSKAIAETLVKESGIPATIIRPTLVMGPGSPIWGMLSKIATLPLIPLPGGGRSRLQPIHVNDLVSGIELVLAKAKFTGELLELGGPSVISFAELVSITHRAYYGEDPRFILLPLTPLRMLLAVVEPLLGPVLPITAGQLAVFANDSVVSPNWLQDKMKERMGPIDEVVSGLAAKGRWQFFREERR